MLSIFDRLAPPERRDEPDYMRRIRIAGVYCATLGFFGVTYGFTYIHLGAPPLMYGTTLVTGFIALFMPLLLRARFPIEALAMAGSGVLILLQVVQVYVEGEQSWAHAWLIAAPLVAQNLGGVRPGLISAVASMAALAAIVWLRSIGLFPAGPLTGVGEAGLLLELGSLLVVMYVLSAIPVRLERAARGDAERANRALTREIIGHEATQAQLRRTQDDLVQTARTAGMAEVATGVLHNMGNALNTVTVTAQVLKEATSTSAVGARLRRAASLLTERPEQHAGVATYLDALAVRIDDQRKDDEAEFDRLIEGVAHVASVVAAQQAHARNGGLVEEVDLSDLIDRVLSLARPRLTSNGVRVTRTVPSVRITTESHQVVQILVNLLNNAADALSETEGRRTVHVVAIVRDAHVDLHVRDNGPGIPKELRSRVFEHGFTTKTSGNGFGLHVSALAARSIGGALSLGPSTSGATLTLTLPLDGTPQQANVTPAPSAPAPAPRPLRS